MQKVEPKNQDCIIAPRMQSGQAAGLVFRDFLAWGRFRGAPVILGCRSCGMVLLAGNVLKDACCKLKPDETNV